MRMYALSDDKNTLTGLRLAGIEGSFVNNRRDAGEQIDALCADEELAVLIMTEGCAALVPEVVRELKLSSTNPLLVVVPSSSGPLHSQESITELIREAIGIKI